MGIVSFFGQCVRGNEIMGDHGHSFVLYYKPHSRYSVCRKCGLKVLNVERYEEYYRTRKDPHWYKENPSSVQNDWTITCDEYLVHKVLTS